MTKPARGEVSAVLPGHTSKRLKIAVAWCRGLLWMQRQSAANAAEELANSS